MYSGTAQPSHRAAPSNERRTPVADVKVQQKQSLSRQEAARLIAALAEGLGEDGKVTVQLGNSTLELSMTDQVDWELEVEVDGDEIELELELKWRTSRRAPAEDELEEDQSDETDGREEFGGDDSEERESARNTSAEDAAQEGESDEDAAGSGDAESVQAATPDETAGPRRARRSPPAAASKSPFNGVDTAAVRAWAAANGLAVSPRGRIKDEVLQAYRDAGN
jgi:amphi-Trp domain-containing protein